MPRRLFVLVPAFFAAFVGWPSFIEVACPVAAALIARDDGLRRAFRGSSWACRDAVSCCRVQVVSRCCDAWFGLRFQTAMVGMPGCVAYSLEFLIGAVMMFALVAVENTRLFILLEMVQVVFCVETWVPGSSSQRDDADPFEWVEVESYEPEPPCTMIDSTPHVNDLVGEARRRGWCEHELMYHIFEYGVPEGFYSMEAHMKAMASVDESAE